MISDNPGALWIVGNEPDRSGWQDDTMPDMYAVAYHDVYDFIKEARSNRTRCICRPCTGYAWSSAVHGHRLGHL